MDREPALPTNTPRRQENSGYRVVMKEGIQQPLWNAELGVELNQSNRQFPTLLDAQGELAKESAWEAQGDLLLEHRDTGVTLRALGRQMSRPQSGAEYRFRVDETSEMTRSDLAFIVSQSTTADYRWSVGAPTKETIAAKRFASSRSRQRWIKCSVAKLQDAKGSLNNAEFELTMKSGANPVS